MVRTKALVMILAACGVLCLAFGATAEDEKPKYTIKQVMKTAMKGGLLKKVASGKASEEEEKTLTEMLVALSKQEPPKGEAESWKKKTEALVKAAKDPSHDGLGKAANCGACHKAHK